MHCSRERLQVLPSDAPGPANKLPRGNWCLRCFPPSASQRLSRLAVLSASLLSGNRKQSYTCIETLSCWPNIAHVMAPHTLLIKHSRAWGNLHPLHLQCIFLAKLSATRQSKKEMHRHPTALPYNAIKPYRLLSSMLWVARIVLSSPHSWSSVFEWSNTVSLSLKMQELVLTWMPFHSSGKAADMARQIVGCSDARGPFSGLLHAPASRLSLCLSSE